MAGPGVHRSLNFSKHLPDFEYQPIVLTIDLPGIRAANYTTDSTLLEDFPDSIEIYRTPYAQPSKWIRALNRLRIYRFFWTILYPIFWEKMALWPFKTLKTAKQIVQEHQIKLVYTSSGPFSSLILGYLLKKQLGTKWVADLRDPYTDAYSWQFPTYWHWLISRRFESWILSKTDHLIVNTQAVKDLYIQRGILPAAKITVIGNGYNQ